MRSEGLQSASENSSGDGVSSGVSFQLSKEIYYLLYLPTNSMQLYVRD